VRAEGPEVEVVRVKSGLAHGHDPWFTAGFRVRAAGRGRGAGRPRGIARARGRSGVCFSSKGKRGEGRACNLRRGAGPVGPWGGDWS
jgi:hypothetical protein